MNDDQLKKRLSASNPTPSSEPVDPITSDRARALMEDIMSTETTAPRMERNRNKLVAAVAAAAVAVAVLGFGLTGGFGTGDAPAPLVLSAEGGDVLSSCLPFDVEILKAMSPAFGGVVIELTDSVATIEVDRWFTGGDAEIVQINYTPGMEALIGTPSLEVGQRFLITASNGVVNGCGFSGVATPEYEAAFEQAFGA